MYDTGFNAFDGKQTRLVRDKAFYRRNTVAFKEKLEGDVGAVVIKAYPKATLFYIERLFGDLAFL